MGEIRTHAQSKKVLGSFFSVDNAYATQVILWITVFKVCLSANIKQAVPSDNGSLSL